jgi:hypothetical protein
MLDIHRLLITNIRNTHYIQRILVISTSLEAPVIITRPSLHPIGTEVTTHSFVMISNF